MENKEVEKILNRDFNFVSLDNGKKSKHLNKKENEIIKEYIEQLERQLYAKDKALDKACGKLCDVGFSGAIEAFCPAVVFGFTPHFCDDDFCEGSNMECWKEWCENEKTDSN